MMPQALANVDRVLRSGHIAEGAEVEAFEQELTTFLDIPPTHGIVTVNSGTAALDLAAHLAGIGPGSRVLTTPITCTATNSVLANRGAKLVWGHVDEMGLLRAPKVSDRFDAVVVVDWAGRLVDCSEFANRIVIEDAAHAFRPIYDMATRGTYICYSFQAIKHLTTGDGGAVVVPKNDLDRARRLRWFGLTRNASFRANQLITELGYKYHMNDIAAAIGRGNLAGMEDYLEQLAKAYTRYDMAFSRESRFLRRIPGWFYHVMTPYGRERGLIDALTALGVETSLVHGRNDKHPAFAKCSQPLDSAQPENARDFSERNLALPLSLPDRTLERVAAIIQHSIW